MHDIITLEPSQFERIRPLWEALNRLHEEKSEHFKAHFRSFSFEQRLSQFGNRDNIKVFAAKANDRLTGYCIASVRDEIGEIDSVFVLPEHRRSGLGDALMSTAQSWLSRQKINRIRISVAQGNEAVFGFYNKHGFQHRFSVLEKRIR